MPRSKMQKQKLLYLRKILLEKTDENHGMTITELIEELASYGISAERKSLYDDLRTLESFGMDICSEKTRTVRYYVGSRDFQISELKLLIDAIQSSKFITEKKSMELISKVEALAGENEARLLQEQVIISNRVKAHNETIYYNVDRLNNAIGKNSSVTFYYNQWVLDLGSREKIHLERRHQGELYRVSPWAMCWDDENYYLIAFDEKSEQIRHYRIDKMEKIELTGEERLGRELAKPLNMADYAKSTFSMFAGEPVSLTLSVDNSLIGVIADRFGKNIFVKNDDTNEGHFIVTVNVNISDQFFGWLFALGDKIKIISPGDVAKRFKKHSRKVSNLYKEARV